MISSVELRNWKTHEHTILEFEKGTNLIVGEMGSGKSSVMDAISFALFGTFPSLKRNVIKTDLIIMNRPEQKKKSEISLKFDIGGNTYKVIRTLEIKKSSSATLFKNDKLLQTQPERVNEEISNILKINYNVFSRAIYSEQNGISYFLDITKSERKKQIDSMLGLDEFAKAEERITTLINGINSALKDEEQIISNIDIESLKKDYAKLKELVETERTRKLGLEDAERGKRPEIDSLKKRMDNSKKEYLHKMDLIKESTKTKSRIDTIMDEIVKVGLPKGSEDNIPTSIKAKIDEDKRIGLSLEEIRRKDRELRRQIVKNETELNGCNKKLEERNSLMEKIKSDDSDKLKKLISDTEEEIEKRSKKIAVISERIEETEKWIAELNKHISICPVCEREIDEKLKERLRKGKDTFVKSEQVNLQNYMENIRNLKKDLNNYREKYEKLEIAKKRLSEYGDLEKEIKTILEFNEKRERELELISKDMDSLEESFEHVKKELEKLRSIKEKFERKRRLTEELNTSELKLKSTDNEISLIEINLDSLNTIQENYSNLNKELEGIQAKLEEINRSIEIMITQLESRESDLDRFSIIIKRVKKRSGIVENLIKFKKALGITSTTLRSSLISSINELMSDLWNKLYPYGDYPSIRINAENEDYSLEANVGKDMEHSWVSINTVASGGERSIACLAMRIAIGMVIVPNLRWIILDEPTHNIDRNGIRRLSEAFGESLPEIVEQIFIITHDEDLREIHNAKMYSLSRDKEIDGATVAETL